MLCCFDLLFVGLWFLWGLFLVLQFRCFVLFAVCTLWLLDLLDLLMRCVLVLIWFVFVCRWCLTVVLFGLFVVTFWFLCFVAAGLCLFVFSLVAAFSVWGSCFVGLLWCVG